MKKLHDFKTALLKEMELKGCNDDTISMAEEIIMMNLKETSSFTMVFDAPNCLKELKQLLGENVEVLSLCK